MRGGFLDMEEHRNEWTMEFEPIDGARAAEGVEEPEVRGQDVKIGVNDEEPFKIKVFEE